MFGENVGMGPFEPILCQKGFYCPSGTEKIKCPAGSYCQPGTAEPTPCAVGSYCPKGAFAQVFWLPFLILLFVNAFVALGLFVYTYRQRFRYSGSQDRLGASVRGQGLSGVKAHITGYKALFDDRAVVKHENDHEIAAMNATYMPSPYDQFSGFEAALDFRGSWAPGQYDESGKGTENLNPHLRAFVDSMRKATDAADFGLSFKYADLRFEPKKSPRPVLQNVTGSIDRGKLTAVMGGSGAGKSTFVNVLMGKTRNTGGEVAVNDRPGKLERYKKVIGFVPQDDIVSSDLTVYENIAHSARVRLPASWSASEIDSLVDSVIDCLELSHVRDSLVGSVGQPVISGGQRKRVSIGVELAAAPMAIFLDEPTSGLDAAAASSITRTLKALARLGISVIVIIHQPRAEIFSAFDKLILLGNGQTVYEGSPTDAKRYFEGVGFQFPKHSNHGDVVTDIITGNGRDYKTSGDISKEALIDNWASYRTGLVKQEEEAAAAGKGVTSSNGQRGKGSNMQSMLRKRGARWHRQAWLCLCRAVLQQYRALGAFWAEMGLAALAGLLLGLAQNGSRGILFRGLYNEPYGILSAAVDYVSVPQMALLVAISIGLVAAAPGVRVFSEEMLLHRREAEAGHSRSAYFLAKTASVLPRMLLACLHFTTPHLVLATPIISWGLAFAANLAYFWCIYGLAAVVAVVARREDAPLFATMVALVAGILSGAAPPLAQVKGWGVEWLWRTSPGVWLAEVYFGQLVGPLGRIFNVELAAELTGYHLNWLWRNLLTLFGIGIVYRLVAFGGLVVVHRLRR
ncbi:hypothetical protein N3K66_002222 [Trichothecium roseum]|uniref:Uncharacterized protein n=1 Tax=Trichothecium roseum TaxID=47278 RepID=A0ACC0VAY4_9HYPO|nr:hypothetical protein N3K66_002222 [Trichothecium roseum]